jgi:exodeoxyribonuclease-3
VTLRLLSYNIRFGGVGREAPLAAVIRKAEPDVVVFQEATRPAVIEQLARETGMVTWGASPGHSVGFMSRMEMKTREWRLPRGSSRSLLELEPEGLGIKIFGVHLTAIHSNWTEGRRVRELHAILADISSHREGFHLLTGDFNTLAPGEKLDVRQLPRRLRVLSWVLGGKIRWRTIQILLEQGYVDGYRKLHPEAGFTFPSWRPHIPLDYVFLPASSADRLTQCEVLTGPEAIAASDHFPLLAVLEV